MQRASDLLSERDYWHALRAAVDSIARPNAPNSVYGDAAADVATPPLSESQLLADGERHSAEFARAARLPPQMSAADVNAVHVISSLLMYNADAASVDERAANVPSAISVGYKLAFGRSGAAAAPLSKPLKGSIARAARAEPFETTLAIGAPFRAVYDAKLWPAESQLFAEPWRAAFRCTPADASAMSGYLYVASVLGAFTADAKFGERIVRAYSGTGDEVGDRHKTIDSLVHQMNAINTRIEENMVSDAVFKQAVATTLRQAALQDEK